MNVSPLMKVFVWGQHGSTARQGAVRPPLPVLRGAVHHANGMDGKQRNQLLVAAAAAAAVAAGATYLFMTWGPSEEAPVAEVTPQAPAPVPSGGAAENSARSLEARASTEAARPAHLPPRPPTCRITTLTSEDVRCPSDGLSSEHSTCDRREGQEATPGASQAAAGGTPHSMGTVRQGTTRLDSTNTHHTSAEDGTGTTGGGPHVWPAAQAETLSKRPSISSVASMGSARSDLSSLRIDVHRTGRTFGGGAGGDKVTQGGNTTASSQGTGVPPSAGGTGAATAGSGGSQGSGTGVATSSPASPPPSRPLNIIRDRPFAADYELQESIGRGTFSVVRKCVHRATGQVRAVKCIDTRRFRLSSTFDADTLLAEVRILASLAHPNIIALFDVFFSEEEDMIYSVTELAAQGELFDSILASGNFSEAQAQYVVWQVLQALAFMHGRGVVHRDIKPENILVFGVTASQGQNMLEVKLADFGTSRMLGTGGGARTFVGSPQYVAPEILFAREGRTSYGTQVDVWSVGVTLFAMLAGYLPFDDAAHPEDERGWEGRIKAGAFKFAPPVWTHISPSAQDLISHMLTVDPHRRWSVQQCMEHPWLASLNPPEGRPSGASSAGAQTAPPDCAAPTPPHAALTASSTLPPPSAGPSPSLASALARRGGAGQAGIDMATLATVGRSLDLDALSTLQKSIALHFAEAYDSVRRLPAAAEAVRRHAVDCRSLQGKVQRIITGFRDKSTGVLELLEDLNIAVEDGDKGGIKAMFTKLKEWVNRLRTESTSIQEGYSNIIMEVQMSLEQARALRDAAVDSSGHLLPPSSMRPLPLAAGPHSGAMVLAGPTAPAASPSLGHMPPDASPGSVFSELDLVDLVFDPSTAGTNTTALASLLAGRGGDLGPADAALAQHFLDSPRHMDTGNVDSPRPHPSPEDPVGSGRGFGWSSGAEGTGTPAPPQPPAPPSAQGAAGLARQRTGATTSTASVGGEGSVVSPTLSPTLPPAPSSGHPDLSPLLAAKAGAGTPEALQLDRSNTADSLPAASFRAGKEIDLSGARQDSTVSLHSGGQASDVAPGEGGGLPVGAGSAMTRWSPRAQGGRASWSPGGVLARPTPSAPAASLTAEEAEALMRALAALKSVDVLLTRCVGFWGNMELIIDVVVHGKEHSETLLASTTSPRLLARAMEKLNSYREFWAAFGFLCQRYVTYISQRTWYRFLQV